MEKDSFELRTGLAAETRHCDNASQIPTEIASPPLQVLDGGYDASRFNALRHGVLWAHTVLSWEDKAEYGATLEVGMFGPAVGPRSAWRTQQTSNPLGSPAQIPTSIQTKRAHAPPPPEITARRLKAGSSMCGPTTWSRSSSVTRSAGPRRMAPSSTSSVAYSVDGQLIRPSGSL